MGIKRRYKNLVEKFLSKDQGKRFFQFFYNWGATIVLIGVLAKLNHWPYGLGSIFLYIGLITEAIVFAIAAFDKPPKEYQWEQVFPVLDTNDAEDRPDFSGGGNGGGGGFVSGDFPGAEQDVDDENRGLVAGAKSKGFSGHGGGGGSIIVGGGGFVSGGLSGTEQGVAGTETGVKGGGFPGGGGPIVIGGRVFGGGGGAGTDGSYNPEYTPTETKQSFGIPSHVEISEEQTNALSESIKKMAGAAEQISKMSELTDATKEYLEKLNGMAEKMEKFSSVTDDLTNVSETLLGSYRNITDNSDGVTDNSKNYVSQMDALNQNVTKLNAIYEIQIQSITSQMEAISRINAGLLRMKDMYEGSVMDSTVFRGETEKMTHHIAALNSVYARLLNAMTMNMNMNMPGGAGYNPNTGYPGFNQNPPFNPGMVGGYNNPNPQNPQAGNYNQSQGQNPNT